MANRFVPVIHGAALDRPDEQDTIDAAHTVRASLLRLGFDAEVVDIGSDLAVLDELAGRHPLVVFNLVEAIDGHACKALQAFQRLEDVGLTYTGTPASAYGIANCKLASKDWFTCCAIPVPAHWQAGEQIPADVTVIVKSIDEHGSLGMDCGSVLPGKSASAEIARRESTFGGRFFAEEFIDGREFNVSLIDADNGPVILPIAEMDFDSLPETAPRIVDFAAKWDSAALSYVTMQRRFGLERDEPDLAAEIRRLSLAAWNALGLAGYARVDFRVGRDGRVFVLEANANPCLARDAGFAAAASEAALEYEDVISAIVQAAVQNSKVPA